MPKSTMASDLIDYLFGRGRPVGALPPAVEAWCSSFPRGRDALAGLFVHDWRTWDSYAKAPAEKNRRDWAFQARPPGVFFRRSGFYLHEELGRWLGAALYVPGTAPLVWTEEEARDWAAYAEGKLSDVKIGADWPQIEWLRRLYPQGHPQRDEAFAFRGAMKAIAEGRKQRAQARLDAADSSEAEKRGMTLERYRQWRWDEREKSRIHFAANDD